MCMSERQSPGPCCRLENVCVKEEPSLGAGVEHCAGWASLWVRAKPEALGLASAGLSVLGSPGSPSQQVEGEESSELLAEEKNMERPTTEFPKTLLSINFANMLDGMQVSAGSFLG